MEEKQNYIRERIKFQKFKVNYVFFCLETKEPKVQGSNFLGYKLSHSAKPSELAIAQTADAS